MRLSISSLTGGGIGEKLTALFKEAAALIRLHPAEYPATEVWWIAAKCWNRGCDCAKMGSALLAAQLLHTSLDLVQFCP